MEKVINTKELVFVYDFNVSQFYISYGLSPYTIGVGKKQDAYLTFKRGLALDLAHEALVISDIKYKR